MEHYIDPHCNDNNDDNSLNDFTTTWDRFVSLLISLGPAILAFLKSIFLAPFSYTYTPRVYTPAQPAYFTARKRDSETIVTNVMSNEMRAAHCTGVDAYMNFKVSDGDEKAESERKLKKMVKSAVMGEKRETERVSIRSFVESRCPTFAKDYIPSWWLRNGNANTIACIMYDFTKKDVVDYQRTLLRMPDGGTIGLDFTPPTWERELDPKTPIVVVLHGLSGGSFESYIRDILSSACAPKEAGGLGYRACVMNFRGCAGIPLTSAQLYGGCYLGDLQATLLYLRETYPEAPLLGIGFSLGANVLLRYCEEEGERSRLRSACVLGCPWDLQLNSDQLEERFLYRNIYAKALGGNLVYLLKTHLPTLAKLAPTVATPHIEHILKMRAPTLRDFDTHVSCWMGGRGTIPRTEDKQGDSEFPIREGGGREYYRLSSGHELLHRIKVPFLAFNASDDPIVARIPYDAIIQRSQYVVQVVTPYGGHLGWFEGGWNTMLDGSPRLRNTDGTKAPPERWVRAPVLEWLQATGEDLLAEEFDCLPSSSSSSVTTMSERSLPSPALSPVASSNSLSPYPSLSPSSKLTPKRPAARSTVRVTRPSLYNSKPQEWIFEQGRSGTGEKGDCRPGDEVGYMFLVKAETKVREEAGDEGSGEHTQTSAQGEIVNAMGSGPAAASSPIAA